MTPQTPSGAKSSYLDAVGRVDALLPSRPAAPQGRGTTEDERAAMREWTRQVALSFIGLTPGEAAALASHAAILLERSAISPVTGCRLGEMHGGARWTVFLDYDKGRVARVATFQ